MLYSPHGNELILGALLITIMDELWINKINRDTVNLLLYYKNQIKDKIKTQTIEHRIHNE